MQTCSEVRCSFDQTSSEFTLVKIISLGLDKFADRICKISGALHRTGPVSSSRLTLSWFCLAIPVSIHSDTHLCSQKGDTETELL